jgi:hypothetical protein
MFFKNHLNKTFEQESQLKCFNYNLGIKFVFKFMVLRTLAFFSHVLGFFFKNEKRLPQIYFSHYPKIHKCQVLAY